MKSGTNNTAEATARRMYEMVVGSQWPVAIFETLFPCKISAISALVEWASRKTVSNLYCLSLEIS
jgi:hypothetical protein